MKLASAEKILDIAPIDGADMIELVYVLGWQVVCKKGEYKKGDLVSYIQIDTVVPNKEEFQFLASRSFRVKTASFKKQISQGLVIPLPSGNWKEGDDLTEILEIIKYEKDVVIEDFVPPIPKKFFNRLFYHFKYGFFYKWFSMFKTQYKKPFPTELLPKTDEDNIQNVKNVLELYKDKEFVVSEKLNGSSITLILAKNWFGKLKMRVCSRKWEILKKDDPFYVVAVQVNMLNHLKNLSDYYDTSNIMVQGEYIGKPQGNYYKLDKNYIKLFNIYVNGKRLNQEEFYETCHDLNIPSCPYIEILNLNFTLPEILKYAEAKSKLFEIPANTSIEREGVVFRCIENNKSFKVISNKYLLKHES